MATLYTQQSKNITKTWLLMSVFLVIVIGIGFFFSQYYGNPNILYIFVIFSIVMNVASYWYSDKIALKLNHARYIKREDNIDLWNTVENLSITAGLPMPKVCIMEEVSPNAFATGRDKNHAVVCVTTGLLSILDKTELEGVIAHELSHIGNRDILLSTVVVVLVGFVSIVADIFLRSTFFGLGRSRDSENNNGGIMIIVGIVISILVPIFAMLLQFAISRKREFLADASGALITRYPEGLASALQKISSHSSKMQYANKATAHLFIVNPFGSGRQLKKEISSLFSTHPKVEDRIKALIGR
ncbi:zinc metalloprotease HtpX [Candidatus Nomurabacteria bacterium CG_4_10_14_0_2_um_filter_30_12]|uniref:Protease HtpX homolog n=3 Tax=Candidatus Nomuraibacteriota TaxID=1752729 RepID=A0A1J4UYC1_9BACT|nr:MAG: zinc metalloprotease HtpX [Candidatus Nomurabacteria bacterium CG1_02_31_12]PIR69007.1 MAG: zinc metalloprotease HtpX [Candidatus Nomurabacteria bacterium CG10_big_fil_rev_8_21_14_0_10_03_31_7]PIZ87002.1 MAG: zinc metalloprotease HtpX [Candidatus Nomurabacteria bacterium CG_4_10_14_0_2_um_filter_30_12]